MGRSYTFARLYDATTEEHGNKHALPCANVRHIATLEEVAATFIGQDSSIEGIGGRPDYLFPTDEVIEVIDLN